MHRLPQFGKLTTVLANGIWGALSVDVLFYYLVSFFFLPLPCNFAVHVEGFFFIDLSGFDTSSYVMNWGETITVICKRLMKHCLVPGDLTWFAQHCSLLLSPLPAVI